MSPVLFNVYTDELEKSLVHAGPGCKIGGTMANCFFYADDICLLSPSVFALQELLLTASGYALEHNISFNVEKIKAEGEAEYNEQKQSEKVK